MSSSKLDSLFAILQTSNEEDYADSYRELTYRIQKETDNEVIANMASVLTAVLKRDLKSESTEILNAALAIFSKTIELETTVFETDEHLNTILLGILSSKAPIESLKACFTVMSEHRLSQPYLKIIQIIYDCTYTEGAKNTIREIQKTAILDFFSKLISNKENESHIRTEYVKLLSIMLSYLVDENNLVRKNANETAEKYLSTYPTSPTHIAAIASCLKHHTMKRLKELHLGSSEMLLEILNYQSPLILKIMGSSIRKSSSVINALLSVVEQGFRHSKSEIKTASFKAWDCLINCFSEDIDVLSSSRYMKLLMQPLAATQSSDALNIIRIETLWSLAIKLKNKLPALFTTVCLPIIHSCLGNLDSARLTRNSSDKTPVKSRLSGTGLSSNMGDNFYAALKASGYRATPQKASKNPQLQRIGVELLVHMLQPSGDDGASQNVIDKFRMPPLSYPLLSTMPTFVSHSQLFITAVSEVLCHMTDNSNDIALVLWNRLLCHVKLHLETNLKKKKRETELFNFYLQTLQNIVNTQSVSPLLKFRFVRSFLELPDGILSSTFYGGTLNGMHGVPVLCLLRLLFSGSLISNLVPELSAEIETCANNLILHGFENKVRILLFCRSVMDIMQSFVSVFQNTRFEKPPDVSAITCLLLKVWSVLGKNLNRHILKSQEVNQGDSLDHDFSAMYTFLLFPICLEPTNSNFMETWTVVYKTFLWCTSFVTTCKPNEACDHISSTLLKEYSSELPEFSAVIFASLCKEIVYNAEFDHDGFMKPNRMSYVEAAASPASDSVPLPDLDKHINLRKFCALLKELFCYNSECSSSDFTGLLVSSLSQLFKSIHHNADVRSLFCYFAPALKSIVECKDLENKTFQDFINEVMTSNGKAFAEKASGDDTISSLLMDANVVDFLLSCFKTKDRKVKNIAVEFWRQVVVDMPIHNKVCEVLSNELKSNLFSVYKHMGWDCPWKDIELPNSIAVIAGPSWGDNFTQSIRPTPGYGAFGSPIKKHSFLSPKKSPLRCSSPVKTPLKTPTRVKRKLGNMGDDVVTYVKCSSPYPKPNTPLTEHQKEKKRQRGFIPAMYNSLDETQENEVVTQDITEGNEIHTEKLQEENCPDIVKASQTEEVIKTKKQKHNEHRGKQNINLIKMTAVQKENEDDIAQMRRSRRLQSRQSTDQKIPTEYGDIREEVQDENVEIESSDNDSLIGKATEKISETSNIDTTVASEDGDVSTEYVEIADASTNHTYADISIDDEVSDDGKDLGVTPLDESYEYVTVADMSVNVNESNKSLYQRDVSVVSTDTDSSSENGARTEAETTKDVSSDDLMNDTDAKSEYEAVAMVDMSTNPEDLAIDDHNKDNSSDDIDAPKDVIETNEKEIMPKKDDNRGKPLRRSLRNQKTEYVDTHIYISSDGEGDAEASFEIEEQEHKSLNETEYEYVEVADTSTHIGNEASIMQVGDQEKVYDAECMNELVDIDMDETNADDDFIDAVSSLGGEVSVLNETDTINNDVVNISGESSASGDLFETSVESDSKCTNVQSEKDCDENTSNKENVDISAPKTLITNLKKLNTIAESTLQSIPESSEMLEGKEIQKMESSSSSVNVENNTASPPQMSKNFIKASALATVQNQTSGLSEESPSAKSILKRRITIGPISFSAQSPNNRRRVSFAEPISKSKRVENSTENYIQSPRSSLTNRKKHSPRAVNRRLSLQPERKTTRVEMSPLSLRSVHVAQAIANIKSKDPSSPSTTPKRMLTASMSSDIDIKNLSLKDLEDPDFVDRISKSQRNKLIYFLLKITTKLQGSVVDDP